MEIAEGRMTVVESASDTLASDGFSAQSKESIKNITFGSVAGMVGKVVEYPFDTVKVRLQSQPDHLPLLYKGPLDCFQKSIRRDGVIGIYRGLSAPLFGAAVENSSLFFSYRIAQDVFRATMFSECDTLPMSALLCCGAISGAATSLLLTPIELVKCKLQVPLESQSTHTPKLGIAQTIASVYRHQGIFGFWRGQLGTLIRETGGSAAWFGSWEGTSHFFRRMRNESADVPLPLYQQLIAGASAGVSYNFLFYPADTIKSRMQTENVSELGGARTRSFWAIAEALWKQQGLKGMYRGCGVTVARSAPSSALIFTVYDLLMRSFWVNN